MDETILKYISNLFTLTIICSLLGIGLGVPPLLADGPTTGQCLSCHGDPSLKQALPGGGVRSLFVDPQQWNKDIHKQKGFSCTDCHFGASIGFHPVGGFDDADCAVCHAEDCETFVLTVHAALSVPGTRNVSGCQDCHTAHAVRSKDDPEASIALKRIASTCSSCHPDEAASSSWINQLAFYRISGHKKEDISQRYDMSQCIRCHFRDGAHGQPDALAERCATCHKKGQGIDEVFSRSIHTASVLGGGKTVSVVKLFYGVIFIGTMGRIAVIFFRKRKDQEKKGGREQTGRS